MSFARKVRRNLVRIEAQERVEKLRRKLGPEYRRRKKNALALLWDHMRQVGLLP